MYRYIFMYIRRCIATSRVTHAFLTCDSHTRQVSFICATFLVYLYDMRKV